MKAILLEKAGGVENLILKEVDQPIAKESEVLIEVKAISINPVDFKVRGNDAFVEAICGSGYPLVLGWDIAGKVVSIGDKVTQFKADDNVFGMTNFPGRGNAYAELVAAPENHLAKMPDNVSFEEAAATTLAALTALQVFETRIKKGDRVLIHAGSGGVGHFAIQIAKHLGAYVVTTSSEKNKEFVLSLGADEHIDYRNQAFEEVASNIDFVLDGMGGDVLLKSLKVLKDGGAVVSLPSGDFSDAVLEEAKKRNLDVSFKMVQSNDKDMNTLGGWLADGVLKPHIYKTFSLSEMNLAHAEIEKGRTVGKIVVKP